MTDTKNVCVSCEGELTQDRNDCPHCGASQPVAWMIYLVYGLFALFVLGVVYRLIWP